MRVAYLSQLLINSNPLLEVVFGSLYAPANLRQAGTMCWPAMKRDHAVGNVIHCAGSELHGIGICKA